MNTTVCRVDLTRGEVAYLNRAGFLPLALSQSLKDVRWQYGRTGTLDLSHARVEEFREAFTEQLAKVGFDETYELTPEGRILEDLIDNFHDAL